MGADRKIEYPEGLLLYDRPGVNLKIVFEQERLEDFDKVTAIPGSAFIVDTDHMIPKLIPWKDYPLELTFSDCRVVPYNILEIYESMVGV